MAKMNSKHPQYSTFMRVKKEFHWLLVHEGYMSLFPPIIRTQKRWPKTRARIITQAIKFSFDVPERMANSIKNHS